MRFPAPMSYPVQEAGSVLRVSGECHPEDRCARPPTSCQLSGQQRKGWVGESHVWLSKQTSQGPREAVSQQVTEQSREQPAR